MISTAQYIRKRLFPGESVKYARIGVLFVVIWIALVFAACGGAGGGDDGAADESDNGSATCQECKTQGFSVGGVSFTMVYVPGGHTFPKYWNDSETGTVADAYWIAQTEVTYELWKTVYDWASKSGYSIANMGEMGGGSGTTNQHPVNNIDWRSAMVWCNALTEWYNAKRGTNYAPVYYSNRSYKDPIRTSTADSTVGTMPGDQDNPFVKSGAKGFRLLTSDEWELAARWRTDSTNTVSGYSNPWFTKGNSASNATTYYNDVSGTAPDYAGRLATDAVAVYRYYYDEFGNKVDNGTTATSAVKSRAPNSVGIYDMSGNVQEWCFTIHSGTTRVLRGGSYTLTTLEARVSAQSGYQPFQYYQGFGMRVGKSD